MKSVTPKIMIAIAGIALFFTSAASAQMIPERPNGTPSGSPFDNIDRGAARRGYNLDPQDPEWNTSHERQVDENWRYHGFTTPRTWIGIDGTQVYNPPHAIGGGPIDGLVGRGPPPNVSDPAEINAYLQKHGYTDNLGRFHPGSSVRPYQGHDEAAGDNDRDEDVSDGNERRVGVGDNDRDEDAGDNSERRESVDDNERDEGASDNDRGEDSGDNDGDGE